MSSKKSPRKGGKKEKHIYYDDKCSKLEIALTYNGKTETISIDTTPVSTTNYSLPYISPADEIPPIMNNEIKTETTNLENYTQNYNEQTNYEQVQTTETNETNLENYNQNYNEQANFEQFQTTETTSNTQFDTQTNVQDDRLVKLE